MCLLQFIFFQIPNNAKKRKQARKLVEKARVIQQSKKVSVEEKTNLRRSSRTETTAKRSYCEHEVLLTKRFLTHSQ